MGFLGFILFPFIAAILGVLIVFLYFICICLLIIGVTGLLMNRICRTRNQTDGRSKGFFHAASIILSIAIMLLPAGYVLFGIVSSLFT